MLCRHVLIGAVALASSALAWIPPHLVGHGTGHETTKKLIQRKKTAIHVIPVNQEEPIRQEDKKKNRRRELLQQSGGAFVGLAVSVLTVLPTPVEALVKGVAPPPPKKASGDKPKCTNVEECQAMAEKREQEQREREEQGPPPKVTSSGNVRYQDIEEGPEGSPSIKDGDDVDVFFKVLKLGKRSYDGLSGEGTVVFSRGYGFEDDEDKAGVKSFRTVVGSYSNIAALNEALIGMKVGGTRRFSVLPQMGWRKPIKACDGGPGGAGTGGELKTDYVVVPTATMVEQEACFDMNKQPFPATYAQQRRMAQRFDQSLIIEVQVAKIN